MNVLHKVTRKMLALNKMRTGVTIVGILLAAAMFTAVMTCVSSVQNYLYRVVVATEGSWHGVRYSADASALEQYSRDREVRSYTALEQIGYAEIGSTNTYKPYLMVTGIGEGVEDFLPIRITEGRLPQNEKELLLPLHLQSNGGVSYQLGDTLSLALGERICNSQTLDQRDPFDPNEGLVIRDSRTFTVVGFYERPDFEEYSAPGYTALTHTEGAIARADVYLKMQTPREIYTLFQPLSDHQYRVNTNLLRYYGMSNEGSYNRVLYSLATILMGIICFGSIALIYNAFSISVGERTKQFGILKTIGATKRQLRGGVLYEALVLSCIGIPLGVLSGILGIGITLHCTGGMFDTILETVGVSLQLHVSVEAILIAVGLCLVTVLISAWIPAARAIRQNAIDSVRNQADIRIRANKVKSPRWLYKLFGFEGMLADKNFKRNRKKYRATVASLFVSVLLFVSASSFCAYLNDAGNASVYAGHYEIRCSVEGVAEGNAAEQLKDRLATIQGVEDVLYSTLLTREIEIPEEQMHPSVKQGSSGEEPPLICYQYFLDDASFARWAKEQKIDPAPYFEQPMGIAVNNVTRWNDETQRYETVQYLQGQTAEYTFEYVPAEIEGYTLFGAYPNGQGTVEYIYRNEAGEEMRYSAEDLRFHYSARIGGIAKEDPFGNTQSTFCVIYPIGMMEQVLPPEAARENRTFMLESPTPAATTERVEQFFAQDAPELGYLVEDLTAGNEANRALITVINVFSYGFIILISLIALANVFNTISTNIALRRREFAMLRSVGMTEKGLNKMMNYECILYGVKGLSYGLIAAVAVTYLIYRAVREGVDTAFYIPWYSIAIAVGSVFLVVFSTMLYAMRKIKKEDPIEALKNENI